MSKEIAPAFQPDELGFELSATPVPRVDAVHGSGFHYALGPDTETPQANIELYPDAKLIRYNTEGLQITLQGEGIAATYVGGGVVFEATTASNKTMIELNRMGEISTVSTILPPVQEIPQEANIVSPQPNDSSPKEKEKNDRVTLQGRAGRDAELRQTAKGTNIAKFPLAVHEEDERGKSTTWHTIVAFNKLAQEVAESVRKGQEYKVVGYPKEREDRGKTVTEIIAAVVKPPSKKSPPEGQSSE